MINQIQDMRNLFKKIVNRHRTLGMGTSFLHSEALMLIADGHGEILAVRTETQPIDDSDLQIS